MFSGSKFNFLSLFAITFLTISLATMTYATTNKGFVVPFFSSAAKVAKPAKPPSAYDVKHAQADAQKAENKAADAVSNAAGADSVAANQKAADALAAAAAAQQNAATMTNQKAVSKTGTAQDAAAATALQAAADTSAFTSGKFTNQNIQETTTTIVAPASTVPAGKCAGANGTLYGIDDVVVYSSGANDYRKCGENGLWITDPNLKITDLTQAYVPTYLNTTYTQAVTVKNAADAAAAQAATLTTADLHNDAKTPQPIAIVAQQPVAPTIAQAPTATDKLVLMKDCQSSGGVWKSTDSSCGDKPRPAIVIPPVVLAPPVVAEKPVSTSVSPGYAGNRTSTVTANTSCGQCNANESCVSIGYGYYGCQQSSTITNPKTVTTQFNVTAGAIAGSPATGQIGLSATGSNGNGLTDFFSTLFNSKSLEGIGMPSGIGGGGVNATIPLSAVDTSQPKTASFLGLPVTQGYKDYQNAVFGGMAAGGIIGGSLIGAAVVVPAVISTASLGGTASLATTVVNLPTAAMILAQQAPAWVGISLLVGTTAPAIVSTTKCLAGYCTAEEQAQSQEMAFYTAVGLQQMHEASVLSSPSVKVDVPELNGARFATPEELAQLQKFEVNAGTVAPDIVTGGIDALAPKVARPLTDVQVAALDASFPPINTAQTTTMDNIDKLATELANTPSVIHTTDLPEVPVVSESQPSLVQRFIKDDKGWLPGLRGSNPAPVAEIVPAEVPTVQIEANVPETLTISKTKVELGNPSYPMIQQVGNEEVRYVIPDQNNSAIVLDQNTGTITIYNGTRGVDVPSGEVFNLNGQNYAVDLSESGKSVVLSKVDGGSPVVSRVIGQPTAPVAAPVEPVAQAPAVKPTVAQPVAETKPPSVAEKFTSWWDENVTARFVPAPKVPVVEPPAVVPEAPVAKIAEPVVETAAKPKTSISQQIFGEPKTIKVNTKYGESITLFPGDSVNGVIPSKGAESIIPELDPNIKYYWRTSESTDMHILTKEGITVTPNSATAIYIDTTPNIQGGRSQYEVIITSEKNVPVNITRANPEEGFFQKLFNGKLFSSSTPPVSEVPVVPVAKAPAVPIAKIPSAESFTIPIGRNEQPNFFRPLSIKDPASVYHGTIEVNPDGALFYQDKTGGTLYSPSYNEGWIPVPSDGITLTPSTTLQFHDSVNVFSVVVKDGNVELSNILNHGPSLVVGEVPVIGNTLPQPPAAGLSAVPTTAKSVTEPITIPIGRNQQPSFFKGTDSQSVSRLHGEVVVNSDGSLFYSDSSSTYGTTYRTGKSGDFIPVPKDGIQITPETEFRFGKSVVPSKIVVKDGQLNLADTLNNELHIEVPIGKVPTSISEPVVPSISVPQPVVQVTETAAKPKSSIFQQIFGEPKTIKASSIKYGESVTLFPGDSVNGVIPSKGAESIIPELDPNIKYYWRTSESTDVHILTKEGITITPNSATGIYIDTNPDVPAGITPYEITISNEKNVPIVITRANPEEGFFQKLFNGKLFSSSTPPVSEIVTPPKPVALAPAVGETAIPIGRANTDQNYFFTNSTSRVHGEVVVNSEGNLIYRDVGSSFGSSYRIGNTGEFVPVPAKGIEVTPDMQFHFGGPESSHNYVGFNVDTATGEVKMADLTDVVTPSSFKLNQPDLVIGKVPTSVSEPVVPSISVPQPVAGTKTPSVAEKFTSWWDENVTARFVPAPKVPVVEPKVVFSEVAPVSQVDVIGQKLPEIIHPTSPTLSGSTVRVNANGTVEIQVLPNQTFEPLIEGKQLLGGTVVKGQNGNYYLLKKGELDFNIAGVSQITGEAGQGNLLTKASQLFSDRTALNTAVKNLGVDGYYPTEGQSALALINAGYTPERMTPSLIDEARHLAYLKLNPSPSLFTFKDVAKMTTVGVSPIAIVEVVVNRDTITNYIIGLTQKGYYSPTLDAYIFYENEKWYRTDTGAEVLNDLDLAYLKTTDFRSRDFIGIVGAQHLTINQSTFESPEWNKFEESVKAQTTANPYDINEITKAVYNNLTYDPSTKASYITNATGGIIDFLSKKFMGGFIQPYIYKFSDRTFQNVLAKNLTICFDFAAAEQSYLAKLGISSELATGKVDFGDGIGGGHAFLLITDKDGKKWIADPTGGFIQSYDSYIKDYKVTDLTITPSIYGFTNSPTNATANLTPNFFLSAQKTVNGWINSLSALIPQNSKSSILESSILSVPLPLNNKQTLNNQTNVVEQEKVNNIFNQPTISLSQKFNNFAVETNSTPPFFGIPKDEYKQIFADGKIDSVEKRILYENYYKPSPDSFLGSGTNYGGVDVAVSTLFFSGDTIRQQMSRGYVLTASGQYGFHDDLLSSMKSFDFLYSKDPNRNDPLLQNQSSTIYAYLADQNPLPNGEPTPVTYDQLNERQKRIYDLTNISQAQFTKTKLDTIANQSQLTPEEALSSGKYIGIIATKSVNDIGRRYLIYKNDPITGTPQFFGVVLVGDTAKRSDWIGSGAVTVQGNADFINNPLGTRIQNGEQWGFDLTRDLYTQLGGTGGPVFGIVVVDPDTQIININGN